jgi:hypothetical protein
VATFVPAQADFQRLLLAKMTFGIHKVMIAMSRANDLRIRNAWVGSSILSCGTNFQITTGTYAAGSVNPLN